MTSSSEALLARDRITNALTGALASHHLVIVIAPMGYGKSTACGAFLDSAASGRVLHLSARPSWREPDAFWEASLRELSLQGASVPHSFTRMRFPRDGASLYHVLSGLKRQLSGTPTTLVIDDYQYSSSEPLDAFMEALVREEIPGLSLLLFSRRKPLFALGNLRLQGHACLFGPGLLLFNTEEARALFAQYGVTDTDIADTALRFSEGWAAALSISLRRYLEQGLLEPVRDMEKIINELFFEAYEERDQKLLMQLSVLGAFTSRQAAELSDDPGAGRRVRELCGHNSLLHYNEAADRCSMHGLLRAYLTRCISEKTCAAAKAIDLQALHRKVAQCALADNDAPGAIRHYALAGGDEDLLAILRMFEKPGEGLLLSAGAEEFLAIMEAIPWRVRRRCPVGYLGFIHRYMVRVDRNKATELLLEAEEEFTMADGPHDTIQGEIELIHAVREFNDFAAMCRRYETARGLLRGRSSLVNERMFWTFNSPHSAFLYLREPGGYKDLLRTAKEHLGAFDELSGGANAGAFDLLLGEYLLETGEGAEAVHHLRKGEYKARQSLQYRGLLAAAFLKARLRMAEGKAEKALAELDAIDDELKAIDYPPLMYMSGLCRGYIAASCNNIKAIPAWLLGDDDGGARDFLHDCDFAVVVRGMALAAVKDWARLEAHAESAARRMEQGNCLLGGLHMALCRAIAAYNRRVNSSREAEAHLKRAGELAFGDGIVTSIAEYGGHLLPLLQRLERLHPHNARVAVLAKRARKYARTGAENRPRLTAREKDILERAATGASNTEIGEALGIVPGSVANTLSRIYGKLGVNCRMGAVRKWSSEARRHAV